MINFSDRRARAPIAHMDELHFIEAASVIYLRLWSEGDGAQALIASEFDKADKGSIFYKLAHFMISLVLVIGFWLLI